MGFTNLADFSVKVTDELLSGPCRVVTVVDINDSETDGLDRLEAVVNNDALDKFALQLVEDHFCLANRLLAPCPCLGVHQKDKALRV